MNYFSYHGSLFFISGIIVLCTVLYAIYDRILLRCILGGKVVYCDSVKAKNQEIVTISKIIITLLLGNIIIYMFDWQDEFFFNLNLANIKIRKDNVITIYYSISFMIPLLYILLSSSKNGQEYILYKEKGIVYNHLYYPYNKIKVFKPAVKDYATSEMAIYGIEFRTKWMYRGNQEDSIIIPYPRPMSAFFETAELVKKYSPNSITDASYGLIPGNSGTDLKVWEYTQQEIEYYTKNEK